MEELIERYKPYGITADLINRLIYKGLSEYGYTEEQAVLLTRYTLGVTLGQPERFTLTELATMTGEKPKKVLDHIEALITPIVEPSYKQKFV